MVGADLPADQCNSNNCDCELNPACCNVQPWFGGDINTLDGNHIYPVEDLSIPVVGGELSFERIYASQFATTSTPLGYGWTHDYAARLYFTDTSFVTEGLVIVTGQDGSRLRFLEHYTNSTLYYTPYPGVQGTLLRQGTAPSYTYVLTGSGQTAYTFNTSGYLTQIADPQGHTTTLDYTSTMTCTNLLDQVTAPDQDATSNRYLAFTYDEDSCHMLTVQDHAGRTANFTYDQAGDLVRVTDTRGFSWTYTYSGSHLLYEVLDPYGHLVERTAYDGQNRAISQTVPMGDDAYAYWEVEFVDNTTRVLTDPRKVTQTIFYDARNTWIGTAHPTGEAITRSYDTDFNLSYTEDAKGNPTEIEWSECGCRPTRVTDALSNTYQMSFDERNNPTSYTDPLGNSTTYTYLAGTNLLASSTNAQGNTTTYEYSDGISGVPDGLLITTTNPLGRQTVNSYDGFGQLVATVSISGSERFTTTYLYDTLGRVTQTIYAAGTDYARSTLSYYDEAGHLTRTVQNCSAGSYAACRAVTPDPSIPTENLVTEYTFDAVGNRTHVIRYVSSTKTIVTLYAYDAANRLVATKENYDGGKAQNEDGVYNITTEHEYDEAGNLITTTNTFGVKTVREYDEFDRVEKVVKNFQDGNYNAAYPDQDIVTQHAYDENGNQIRLTNTLGIVTAKEYDELNRLKKTIENYDGSRSQNEEGLYNITTQYGYDKNSNQILVTDTYGMMDRTEYDELGRAVSSVRNYTTTPDSDPTLYNITTRYAYNAAGQQVLVANPLGIKTTTAYDGAGRSVARTQNYDPFIATPTTYVDNDPGGPAGYYYWLDPTGETVYTLTSGTKQASISLPGGKSFSYYGSSYTSIWATRYGYLYFGSSTTPISYTAAGTPAIPAPAAPNNVVAPLWSEGKEGCDLVVRAWNATDPFSTDDLFVVEYVDYYASASAGSTEHFQVILNLDKNSIVFQYEDFHAEGQNIGVGIENSDGSAGVGYYHGAGTPAGNEPHDLLAILFTGQPSDVRNVTSYYGYDAAGRQVTTTSPLGIETVTEYDPIGRTSRVIENFADGSYSAAAPDVDVYTLYRYDVSGNRTQAGVLGQYTTTHTYDDLGRQTIVSDPLTHAVTSTYDALGRLLTSTDANGNVTRFGYDDLGRTIAITDPLGQVTYYVYDGLGRKVRVTDAAGIVTSSEYDALGRLVTVTENYSDGGPIDAQTNVKTVYAYDARGNRVSIVNARGYTTTYAYDALSRLISESDPLEHTWSYGYDALSRRITVTDPLTQTVSHYDALGRLLQVDYGVEVSATYAYNALGRRTAMTDATGLTEYRYDDLGRTLLVTHSVEAALQYTAGYAYDGRGLRTGLDYPDGTRVSYGYDDAGRLETVSEGATTYAEYSYDDGDRLIAVSLGNGLETFYQYDAAGQVVQLAHYRGEDLLARYGYEYNRAGNRTRAVETVLEGGGSTMGIEQSVSEPAAPTLPLEPPLPEDRPEDDVARAFARGVVAAPLYESSLQDEIVRERAGYQVSFDEQGLHYRPKTRLVETEDYHLDFRLTQVKSGQSKLFHPGSPQNLPASPPGQEDRVHYDRGEVFREEYLITDSGIEQCFVFEQRFELDGDLEIEGNLTGNLKPTLNEASGEIQFLTPSGEAVASYGRAIVVDAVGRQMVATLELTGAHLRVIVPERWLAEAVYPVVVDPLIGSNFAVTTQAISGDQERAAIASAGGGAYLVAWHGDGSGDDIFAQMVSAEGALISETITLDGRPYNQRYPDVAANVSDTNYLVVWQAEYFAEDWNLYAHCVASDGARLGERIEIYTGAYDQEYPAVTFNDSGEYLVVWRSYDSSTRLYGIYGQIVAANGSLSGSVVTIFTSTASLSYPDVTFNISDSEYLVVWQKNDRTTAWDIWGRIVEADGSMEEAAFAISEDALDQSIPAATYSISDSEYLVVWQSYTTGSSNNVYGRRVDAGGNLLGDRIEVAVSIYNSEHTPSVIYGEDLGEYLVLWAQGSMIGDVNVYGQRIAGDGSPAGSAITIYSGSNDQSYPAVAYDELAAEYMAIWQDYRSGSSWEIYGQQIEPDGDLVGQDFLVSAEPAEDKQERAAVAYGVTEGLYLAVWQDYRNDNYDIYGQLLSSGGALVGEPFAIAASSNFHERAPAVAYDVEYDEFLVVWEQQAVIGIPNLNIYGQRVDGDGDIVGSALALCTNGTNQSAAAVAYNQTVGYFLVAWDDDRNGDGDIYARAVVTENMESEFVVYTDLFSSNDQRYPAIAANEGSGEYLVVWQHVGASDDVYGQRVTTTETVGEAFTIANSANDERRPTVAFNEIAAEYLVAYEYESWYQSDVRGKWVSAGGSVDSSELTIASGEDDQLYPALAWDSSSQGYALAWQEGSSSGDIHGLILDHYGTATEAEATLSAAANAQERPAIAYDADLKRYLVVWEDHRHSTESADVYGQLYAGHSRVIDYTYDPLQRLVSAGYSTGESFEYIYDAAGNRTVMTSVTPLSGTVVTTYTWDAANRLTARQVSDGRSYTYTWSLRNELLAEWTLGYDVRTFSYDAAGRMISATVFTQTTYFTYAGDGTRLAVEVDGYGTTRYVPDYTRRWRVLLEQTATTSTLYLYGGQCLAERRDGEWLYHLMDGTGYVRQVASEEGTIEGAWLYDPDGWLLEGPEGPVSHLICGGIYDWSTGLIYKDGRYFDPSLGIYLALGPLSMILLWQERRKGKKRHLPWWMLVALLMLGVGGGLVGCGGPETPEPTLICVPTIPPAPGSPTPSPAPTPWPPTPTPEPPTPTPWPPSPTPEPPTPTPWLPTPVPPTPTLPPTSYTAEELDMAALTLLGECSSFAKPAVKRSAYLAVAWTIRNRFLSPDPFFSDGFFTYKAIIEKPNQYDGYWLARSQGRQPGEEGGEPKRIAEEVFSGRGADPDPTGGVHWFLAWISHFKNPIECLN